MGSSLKFCLVAEGMADTPIVMSHHGMGHDAAQCVVEQAGDVSRIWTDAFLQS